MPRLERRAKKWNPVFRSASATAKDSTASGDADLSPDAVGPAFLHRPLPALSSLSLGAAPRWLLGGISFLAPAPFRRALWRPVYRLMRDGEGEQPELVEEAWSGERRLSRSHGNADLPVAVALPEARIFETFADLPAAAKDSLREAVSLRLEALSPIAQDDIVFDVGAPERTDAGRILVPVAIARKDDIRRIEEHSAGFSLHSIGAAPNDDGSLGYVFKRFPGSADALNKAVLAGAALVLAVMVFACGVAKRLDKEIAAIEAHEAALIAELRHHKEITSWLPSGEFERSGVSGEDLEKAFNALAGMLPDGARLIRAAYADGAWSVEGFSPDGASWPDRLSPNLTGSDRPDFQRFEAIAPISEAP